jgi:hypothetical protein
MHTPVLHRNCPPELEDGELRAALPPPLQCGGPPLQLLLRRCPVPPESQPAADDAHPAPGNSLPKSSLTVWRAICTQPAAFRS